MFMFRRFILIASLCLASVVPTHAAFDPCKFNFGVTWDNFQTWATTHDNAPKGLDYVAIWLTENDQNKVVYNAYWQGRMAQYAKDYGLTQVYVSYIIAKMAKVDAGLNDCDVGGTGPRSSPPTPTSPRGSTASATPPIPPSS
jgi:hypothetical protein